ncbi:TrkH family potassium uptake protein [Nocardioides insulae]|uniref:TrkH family potassium uptake protein n=1 Tax=Nocardioides insulae TaxID=394734 RepID=UPI00042A9379|nr:TrkH family potassium uptake protein [Nocardioides insulae]
MALRGSSLTTRLASRRRFFRHPAQVVVVAFAATIALGTVLLMLPLATEGDGHAGFVTALFTATSAVCVTGLVVVDTPTYWSGFGEGVILGLIQLGGLGVMTFASLLGMLVFRRLGLRSRLTAQTERNTAGHGEVRSVIRGVIGISLAFEAVVALALFLRFWLGYDERVGQAAYHGVFHAVSAFNNAGFALFSDNLMGFVGDPWIILPICIAIIAGGLGFPVWLELGRRHRPRHWSLHTKLTLTMTVLLLVGGTIFVTAAEWHNDRTLGALDGPTRLLAGFTQSVMPRTAGFNTLDYGQMHESTLLGTDILMFIGGGSAGTAGGIKVTTFILLLFAVLAEVRGDRDAHVFGRRLDDRAIRQALAVVLLAIGAVVLATLCLIPMVEAPTSAVLFEATSAFATVGLSTGITSSFPPAGEIILAVLMFAGRVGTITLVSALAVRSRENLYRLPEGRPLIG